MLWIELDWIQDLNRIVRALRGKYLGEAHVGIQRGEGAVQHGEDANWKRCEEGVVEGRRVAVQQGLPCTHHAGQIT